MIQKYTYGTPFETDAIVTSIPTSEELLHTELSPQRTASLLLMTWMTTMLSMVWANQTAESTNVDTFMKATVPTSQTIQKIKSPLRSTQLPRNLRKADFRSLR